jgi:hypothetical protein
MNDLNDAVAAAHEQADKQQLDRPRIKKYHKTIFNMFQIAQLFSHTNVVLLLLLLLAFIFVHPLDHRRKHGPTFKEEKRQQ